jgi:DNA repair exonuclease SbcCD ATPase subunit
VSLKESEARTQEDAELRKQASLDLIRQERDDVAAKYRLASSKLTEFQSALQGFSVANAYSAIAELNLKEKHAKAILSSRTECPTCGQRIDPHHVEKLLQECITSIGTITERYSIQLATSSGAVELGTCLNQLDECKSKLEERISSNQTMMDHLFSTQRALEMRMVQLENDMLRCEAQHTKSIQQLRERIAAAESVLETHQSMSSKIQTALQTAQPQFERLNLQISNLEDRYSTPVHAMSWFLC